MSEFGHTSTPDLVPARMLNEFTYCPRLFHLEWVQQQFVDNDDTVEGRWQHRAVDVPEPSVGVEPPRVRRSMLLSSEALGLVARIDITEFDGDVAVPVDVKRGSPPDNEERSWEPERVQVCAQGLLLREAGYVCDRGVLYFAAARRRVDVVFDDALVARTTALLAELRAVVAGDVAPPPLVDSPKCPRCSLVGLCLPDEVNLLAGRRDAVPRRLLAGDDDARPLYVTEQGATISKRKGRLVVRRDGEDLVSTRLLDVSQVGVFGNVQVTTQALTELMGRDVPVCFFSHGGWFSGLTQGLPSKHVELRRQQVLRSVDRALPLARRMVFGKIRNSRTLLRRNGRDVDPSVIYGLALRASSALQADSFGELLGIEGAAARAYFSQFSSMLKTPSALPGGAFDFDGRNRRPPRDAVNCLLSYLYGLLAKDCTVTLFAVGFDPYLGFFHQPRFGRPALALDLAEEFRALIADSVVLTLVNNGEVDESSFVVRAGGVALTPDGRRAVLRAYERRLGQELRHPRFGYRASYRRIIEIQARLLGACVLGEVPEYEPVVTR